VERLTFDFDLADSRARFTEIDDGDAAPGSPSGKRVPEAVGWVVSSGITAHLPKGFLTSLRLRYFGPRDLTSDGLYRSKATALLNNNNAGLTSISSRPARVEGDAPNSV
jgi:hypothetical protein